MLYGELNLDSEIGILSFSLCLKLPLTSSRSLLRGGPIKWKKKINLVNFNSLEYKCKNQFFEA